jgi:hypothetical protein
LDVLGKQTDDCLEHGSDGPGGIPFLRMVLSDGEAYLGINLEPSILVHEDDIWRLEGVFIWEEDLAVVQSLMELGVNGSPEGEVPGV